MEDPLMEGEGGTDYPVAAAAPALIAVDPADRYVAVAVGAELRVFDIKGDCAITLSDNSFGPAHSDAIRDISYSSDGEVFVSAGDDKLVKIWETNSWICIRTVHSEKRVSAISVSKEGQFVTFADKFGVVWAVSLNEDKDAKPVPILGHYCSIITSMKFSPDGRFIATADRDFKIRVTVFPKNTLNGSHEIQSFCLGHTDFVSCLTFVCSPDQSQGFLLSGSGDSTVRMWDYVNGSLLHTCELGDKVEIVETNEIEEKSTSKAVTDICASCDGSLIAVAVQSCQDPIALEDSQVPGGEKLLFKLQGSLEASTQNEAFLNVALAVRASLQNMMIKKQYSNERRETRKRNRNDKKIKK